MFIKIGNHFLSAADVVAIWTFSKHKVAEDMEESPAVVVEFVRPAGGGPRCPGGQFTFRCTAEALAAIRRELDAQLFLPRAARDDVRPSPCPAPEAAAPGADRPPRGGYF